MNKKEREVRKLIENADHERVEAYMHMFDRVLLYTLAVNMMPKDAIRGTVDLWDTVVKKGIDMDASKRTNFLEGTTLGRAAKLRQEHDGEDVRNHCLQQWRIARDVISANLHNKNEDNEDQGEIDEPEFGE